LAYLVRRLLENGANSSFVNQIVDDTVPPEVVAADPFLALDPVATGIAAGPDLFAPERRNSGGFDLSHQPTWDVVELARAPWMAFQWRATPVLSEDTSSEVEEAVANPARPDDNPGTVAPASKRDIETALSSARPWDVPIATRAVVLNAAADLYEQNYGQIFAILAREAGKSPPDAVGELREAVDFLRYYAATIVEGTPAGTFTCIAPWNFPLAIFTGQIAAALATGNAVLAKPAEQTPLIAYLAVTLLHQAGVPRSALQLLPGDGAVGAALTSDPRVDGVAFTGSTATALKIRAAMADNLHPGAPLIAETGGLNAMIVDSTALPEQAVQAIVESAFQSAGQRCSALRCLYLQSDIAEDVLTMLKGAMETLTIGDPWLLSTDCGPVIDAAAYKSITDHIDTAQREGRVLKQPTPPETGLFVPPTLIEIPSIAALKQEVFGPVLHVATYRAGDLDAVIDAINATGYGLTFGLQTRIDDRVQHVTDRIRAGNIYVNRNQIGATVGSQPFGGEGLSGTGPKAGGPHYVNRLTRGEREQVDASGIACSRIQNAIDQLPEFDRNQPIDTVAMPGPTGESNQLSVYPRGVVLCLGPDQKSAELQKAQAEAQGCQAIIAIATPELASLNGFDAVSYWGDRKTAAEIRQSLAQRNGVLIPLIFGKNPVAQYWLERHICIDTTASGGNTVLLAAS